MGEIEEFMLPSAEAVAVATSDPRSMPVREDCWSQDATFTLIEAWGRHHIELNRGNLRQRHWQEVAASVNARHGHIKKARRTDVQCKNRIDTLKKKYKIEKARVLGTKGSYKSSWPFFAPLDELIGSTPGVASSLKKSSPLSTNYLDSKGGPPMAVPLLPHRRTPPLAAATALPMKRSSPMTTTPQMDESYFRKNYSAVAAAAAAVGVETDDEMDRDVELDDSRSSGENSDIEGVRTLARAIERFGEVYVRVEGERQRQMIELEKQRMQFGKELETQRMQMLVELQVQLEKLKRTKRSDSNVSISKFDHCRDA